MPKNKKNSLEKLSVGLGKIGDLYHDMEDAEKALNDIETLEEKLDAAIKTFNEKDEAAKRAEDEYDEFNKYKDTLKTREANKKQQGLLKEKLDEYKRAYKEWDGLPSKRDRAKDLKDQKDNWELWDKYKKTKEITEKIEALQNEINGKSCPDDAAIKKVERLQFDIAGLESKLRGVDINATVKMFADNSIEITSVLTGKKLDITDGICKINEAVRITVPGVMEMQLSPSKVNADEAEAKICKNKQQINEIFEKYSVESLAELDKLAKVYTRIDGEIKTTEQFELKPILGETTYDELKAKAEVITEPVRGMKDIEAEIESVCGNSNVDGYIDSANRIIVRYEEKYQNLKNLQDKIDIDKKELESIKEALIDVEDIPEEYMNISDSDAHINSLKKAVIFANEKLKDALVVKTNAVSALENYEDTLSDDPRAKKEEAERKFTEIKTLLDQWMHIQEVFNRQKEELHNNPMQDIADSFTHYLGIISDNKISSEFKKEDKLDPQIYSGSVKLDYGKLSEGTKETVSLAFRLAVLDHLFPDGGGVIVLDDPLTDMDTERAKASCELIKECAKRHQVIFLTCREDYLDMLSGNVIRW